MEQVNIMVFGNLLAAQSEMQGMIWENEQRKHLGQSMGFTEAAFYEKAQEIRDITNQLFK